MYIPGDREKDPIRIAGAIRELATGRSNAVGTVTLTAGAVSTTVIAPNCSALSVPFLMPLTENALAAKPWIASVTKGQFVIGHQSHPDTDMIYGYVCLG